MNREIGCRHPVPSFSLYTGRPAARWPCAARSMSNAPGLRLRPPLPLRAQPGGRAWNRTRDLVLIRDAL